MTVGELNARLLAFDDDRTVQVTGIINHEEVLSVTSSEKYNDEEKGPTDAPERSVILETY